MWPCFIRGWTRQCVGLSFKGRNVSELRSCRKNIFGKLVVVENRHMYINIYLLTLGNFDNSYIPEIKEFKKIKSQILQRQELNCDFDVYMTHV